MKKAEILFSVLLVPVDYLAIILAGFFAYFIRFGSFYANIRPVIFDLPFREYAIILLLVGIFWIPIFAVAGLYAMRGTRRAIDEITRIFFASSVSVMILVLIIFFRREFFSSRFIVIVGWFLAFLFVTILRMLIRELQHWFFKHGIGTHRVILIGKEKASKTLAETFTKRHHFGYTVVEHLPLIDFEKIKKTINHTKIDDIILGDPRFEENTRTKLLEFCRIQNIGFYYAADLFDALTHNVDIHQIGGIPVIEIKKTPLDGWGKVMKRIFDIAGGFLLFVLLSPVFLFVWLLIKISSPTAPAIYKNRRVGPGGNFSVLKFRTMEWRYCTDRQNLNYKNALDFEKKLIREQSVRVGPLYKIKDDPRVTKFGRILRWASLDELPQLLNVLFGNMSLVGPRPHQPREVEGYSEHAKKILSIKPGITGITQVSGRSDLIFDEEVKLDLYYVENWSIKLDLSILIKTPLAVIRERITD